jgi:hypothetical protein
VTDQIRAPWTPEQVAALNRFQLRGGMHPFTCGASHAGPSPALVARPDGWHCPGTYRAPCDYRQDWAHRFMADPDAWPKPFADLQRAAATERSAAPVEPPTRLRRLRAQLAAEHAKAVAADQHPRPDLDHLRVTPHNGIAAGLETALFFVDHHLREVDEEARTTPDNSATSGDAADNSLREQYATVIAELPYYERDDAGSIADAVLAVRDREIERMKLLVAASESPGHAVRMAAQYADRAIENGQRADRLAATLREVLDAFEAYWARASYCGPGETAIQPEHLRAWRNTLDGKEQS